MSTKKEPDLRAMVGRIVGDPEHESAAARRIKAMSERIVEITRADPEVEPKSGPPGPPGPRGAPGPRGPAGEVGPMPAHRWIEGTKLQFEEPDGEWGKAVQLKGDKGEPGQAGASGGVIVQSVSGGGSSYFPGGW